MATSNCRRVLRKQCESPEFVWMQDIVIGGYFKHHFDVFGLIEKGLAIDKNTIE